jgi:hypothetical protein
VRGAELHGEVRLALDAQLERPRLKLAQGEHLPADLEDRDLIAERELLDSPGQSQAPVLESAAIHNRILPPSAGWHPMTAERTALAKI